jgi:lysocardiolipin and lysophospholipid acyltransferase
MPFNNQTGAMLSFGFMFMERKWQRDKHQMTSKLKSYIAEAQPFWLLIFPEGTLLCTQTMSWTREYIEKSGLDWVYEQVLMPKHTGLLHCLRTLSPLGGANSLFDLTIAYGGMN